MSIGIYRLHNTATGESYVGASRNLELRLKTHAGQLSRGIHPNKRLLQSYQECGKDRFEILVLEECDLVSLTVREKYWARHFNASLGKCATASYPDMTVRTNRERFAGASVNYRALVLFYYEDEKLNPYQIEQLMPLNVENRPMISRSTIRRWIMEHNEAQTDAQTA